MRHPNTSLWIGIVISVLFGLTFAIPTYLATAWIWGPLGLALAIGVGGFVTKALLVGGYGHIRIDAVHCGVATGIGDKPTGTILDAGDHWGFPGISGAIPVDIRHRHISLPERFNTSAGDATDIGVDSSVFIQISDPIKTLNVKNIDESVGKLLKSRIRLFMTTVSKAENAIKFRNLLSEYLELEPRASDILTPEHLTIKNHLDNLSKDLLTEDGIDTLMSKNAAGAFKKLLREWGVEVEKVVIGRFDIPQTVKDANLRKATQSALMDAERIRNTARKEMIDDLVKSGVNANNAMNSVDMLLGLSVKKDIREITITDLDKVAEKFGQQIAGMLKQTLTKSNKS